MIVFPLNIALIVFWNAVFKPCRSEDGKKTFCFICGLQWALLMGFRADTYGDTGRYHTLFNATENVPFGDYIGSMIPQLLFLSPTVEDPLFYLLAKMFLTLCGSYRVFLIIVSAIVAFSFAFYIYDNTDEPFWGFLLYSCVFYGFLMSAMRQSLAIALTGFLGFCCVKRGWRGRFVALAMLGILFHKSAVFCLPMLVLDRIPFTRKTLIGSGVLFAALLVLHSPILSLAGPLLGYDGYDYYVGGNTRIYLASYLMIWGAALWRIGLGGRRDRRFELFFWMLTAGILFSAFSFDNSNAFRISFYYTFVMFFLIPDIMSSFDRRRRFHCRMFFGGACVGAFFYLNIRSISTLLIPVGSVLSLAF